MYHDPFKWLYLCTFILFEQLCLCTLSLLIGCSYVPLSFQLVVVMTLDLFNQL